PYRQPGGVLSSPATPERAEQGAGNYGEISFVEALSGGFRFACGDGERGRSVERGTEFRCRHAWVGSRRRRYLSACCGLALPRRPGPQAALHQPGSELAHRRPLQPQLEAVGERGDEERQ